MQFFLAKTSLRFYQIQLSGGKIEDWYIILNYFEKNFLTQLSHMLLPYTRGAYFESLVSSQNYWEKLVAYKWFKIQHPLLFGGGNVTSECIIFKESCPKLVPISNKPIHSATANSEKQIVFIYRIKALKGLGKWHISSWFLPN